MSPVAAVAGCRVAVVGCRVAVAAVVGRLCALAAVIWFNWQIGDPGRHLTGYDH